MAPTFGGQFTSIKSSQCAGTIGGPITVGIGDPHIPFAVAIGIDVPGDPLLFRTQRPVGNPVAVGIYQLILGLPEPVEVNQGATGVLDTIETEPTKLPAALSADRSRPRAVVGKDGFGGSVVVEVEDAMVGHAVTVEVRQCVIAHAVAVEVQPDGVKPPVTVQVEIGQALPDGRRSVLATDAVVHSYLDATPPLGVPPAIATRTAVRPWLPRWSTVHARAAAL